jgi:glyoxylase-like metal-dependent hydrolase (beta-lactamase superfamily II)
VLACGDYLSPVEIPMLSAGGSLGAYRETLARLRPLVAGANWVVPGHGSPLDSRSALEILDADDAYLEALADDPAGASVPARARTSAAQRRIHAQNVSAVGASRK